MSFKQVLFTEIFYLHVLLIDPLLLRSPASGHAHRTAGRRTGRRTVHSLGWTRTGTQRRSRRLWTATAKWTSGRRSRQRRSDASRGTRPGSDGGTGGADGRRSRTARGRTWQRSLHPLGRRRTGIDRSGRRTGWRTVRTAGRRTGGTESPPS